MFDNLILARAAIVLALVATACSAGGDSGSAAGSAGDASRSVSGQSSAGESGEEDGGGSGAKSADIAAIDPCGLVTKEEIFSLIESTYEPGQLAGFKSKGGTWATTPTPQQEGISKTCRFPFTGTVSNGDVSHRSEFKLIVTDGAFVNPDINKAGSRPIPGIGDEAYFMSRGQMMPYARVGKVGVGLEGFPTAKASVELLRLAVARVQKS